jgi:uncharacterized protein DUF4157/HNH/ENDO VII superfamily nuclease
VSTKSATASKGKTPAGKASGGRTFELEPRSKEREPPLLTLQRSAGNRASTALLQQATPQSGFAPPSAAPVPSPVPAPVEADELEADRLAGRIDAVIANPPAPPADRGDNGSPNPPPDTPSGIPRPLREWLERFTGHDLSDVRIRADRHAAAAAERHGAEAFTQGKDIFFAAGAYAPGSREGARLVAHEVAHTVQQAQTGARGPQLQPTKKADTTATVQGTGYTIPNVGGIYEVEKELLRLGILQPGDYDSIGFLGDGYFFGQSSGKGADYRYYRVLDAVYIRDADGNITGYKIVSYLRRSGQALPSGQQAQGKSSKKSTKTAPPEKRPKPAGTAKTGESKPAQEKKPEKPPKAKLPEESTSKEKAPQERREPAEKTTTELQKAFDALPQAYKDLVAPGGKLKPEDLPQLLRIAEKLKLLTPEDLALYKLIAEKISKDLDAFEKSIDFFIKFKAEIRAHAKAEAKRSKKEPTLEEKLAATWKDFDESKLKNMTADEKEAIARDMAAKQRDIQLEHMAKHPGETALGMVEGVVRVDKAAEAIAKDVQEAASGDKGAYSRIAGGVGALNKTVAAVASIVFIVLLFVPGVNLVELAAAGLAVAVGTMALSLVESELRIKAAGQAKTPEEFKTETAKSAAAQANAVVSAALIALTLAAKIVARIPLPGRFQNVGAALKAAQAALAEKSGIGPAWQSLKTDLLTKLRSAKEGLREALFEQSKALAQTAEVVKKLPADEFLQHLADGDPKLADLGISPEQAKGLQKLAGTPEGKAIPEQLRQDALKALEDAPVEAGKKVDQFLKSVDDSIEKVDKSQSAEQLKGATDDAAKQLGPEEQAKQAAADEQAYVKKRVETARKTGVRERAQAKLQDLQKEQAKTQATIERLENEKHQATAKVNRLKNKAINDPDPKVRAEALKDFKKAKAELEKLLEEDELGGYREERAKQRQKEEAILESLELKRPKLSESTKTKVRAKAKKNQEGEFLDANTGEAMKEEPVFGHIKGREHRRLVLKATEKGLTQEQFTKWVNDHPEWFQLETEANNASHAFELPGVTGWETIPYP